MAQDIPYRGRCVARGMPGSASRPTDSSQLGFLGEIVELNLRIDNSLENILRSWTTNGVDSSALLSPKRCSQTGLYCQHLEPQLFTTVREGTGMSHREVSLPSYKSSCDHVLGAMLVAIKLHERSR
jgi:hypothetical protein